MDIKDVIFILVGSTFGLILRIFVSKRFKKKLGININNIALVNILASLFLGVFLAIDSPNKYLSMLFSVGFLGCFSTFSSFIYQLFKLLQAKRYSWFVLNYIEVILTSLFFFLMGYFIISIFKT